MNGLAGIYGKTSNKRPRTRASNQYEIITQNNVKQCMTGTQTTVYCCKSPAFIWDPVFISTWPSEPRRLLETWRLFGTRRLIEVLRYGEISEGA